MIGLIDKLTGRSARPDAPPRLPAELVAGIDRLEVLRRQRDDEDGERVAIRVPGLGSCWLGEDSDLEARILRAWPELTPTCARRAIALIEAEIAERNRAAWRGRSERKPSWVWGWSQ
jgi:hypothetical protein